MKGARFWAVLMAALLSVSTLANDYMVANAESIVSESEIQDENTSAEVIVSEESDGIQAADEATDEYSLIIVDDAEEEEVIGDADELTEEELTDEELTDEELILEEDLDAVDESPAEDTAITYEEKIVASAQVAGMQVDVYAPAEAFPDGTTVEFDEVSISKKASLENQIDETLEDEEVVELKAVDITFYYEGEVVQPDERVRVTFTSLGMEGADEIAVYHEEESGELSEVAANVNGDTAVIEADSFSVYVIVAKDITKDITGKTYELYVGNATYIYTTYKEDWWSQISWKIDNNVPEKAGKAVIEMSIDPDNSRVNIKALNEGTATISCTRSSYYYSSSKETFTIKVSNVANGPKDSIKFVHSSVDDNVGTPATNIVKFEVDCIDKNGNPQPLPAKSVIPNEINFGQEVKINASTFSGISIPGYTFDNGYCYFYWFGAYTDTKREITTIKNMGRISDGYKNYNSFIGFKNKEDNNGADYNDAAGYYAYNPTGTLRVVFREVTLIDPYKTVYVSNNETVSIDKDVREGNSNNFHPYKNVNLFDASYMEKAYPSNGKFLGWSKTPGGEVMSEKTERDFFKATVNTDVYLYAVWQPDANYTTEYYFENINGVFVKDAAKISTEKAKVGEKVTAKDAQYDAAVYTPDTTQGVSEGIVKADGSLVLSKYYKLKEYTLTVNPNGGVWNGSSASTTVDMKTGASRNIPAPTREKYTFAGWDIAPAGTILDATGNITMGTQNITMTAKWVKAVEDVTVYYNLMNTAGQYVEESKVLAATLVDQTIGATVTVADADAAIKEAVAGSVFENYKLDETGVNVSLTVSESDKSITVYYALDKYAVIYEGSTSYTDADQFVGATYSVLGADDDAVKEIATKTGYDFVGWARTENADTAEYVAGDEFNMPAEDVTLYPVFTPGQNQYTIKVWAQNERGWLENISGEDGYGYIRDYTVGNIAGETFDISTEVITGTAVTPSQAVIAQIITKTANDSAIADFNKKYEYVSCDSEVEILADGSTVINVYFNVKEYTVTLDLNEAKAGNAALDMVAADFATSNKVKVAGNVITYTCYSTDFNLPNAYAIGYSFGGWKQGGDNLIKATWNALTKKAEVDYTFKKNYENETFVAQWAADENAEMYILKANKTRPTEITSETSYKSYPAADYSPKVANVDISGEVTANYRSFAETSTGYNALDRAVEDRLTSSYSGKYSYDEGGYHYETTLADVDWYVIKKESKDIWHVDGEPKYTVTPRKFQVYYDVYLDGNLVSRDNKLLARYNEPHRPSFDDVLADKGLAGATLTAKGAEFLKDAYFVDYSCGELKDAAFNDLLVKIGKMPANDITICLNYKTKTTLNLKANSAEYVYDGTAKTAEGYKANGVEVGSLGIEIAGLTASTTETNADEYDVIIKKSGSTDPVITKDGVDVTNQYILNYEGDDSKGKLTISKREVTVTAKTDSKAYDHEALVGGYSNTPLADGQEITAIKYLSTTKPVVEYTQTPQIITKGELDYTVDNAVIMAGNDVVTSNYEIKYIPGKLTITASEIALTITANGGEYMYDGKEHFAEIKDDLQYVIEDASVLAGDILTVNKVAGSAINTWDEGEVTISESDVVIKNGDTDVTDCYKLTINPGKITITKAPLNLTAAEYTLEYNGKELILAELGYTLAQRFIVSEDSKLADGEYITDITVSGSATTPGRYVDKSVISDVVIGSKPILKPIDTIQAAVKAAAGINTPADNYEVTYTPADIVVTAPTVKSVITIVVNNYSGRYDGDYHTANRNLYDGLQYNVYGTFLGDPVVDKVDPESVVIVGSIREVGTQAATVAGGADAVKILHGDVDVTECYDIVVVPGTLTITRIPYTPDEPGAPEDTPTVIPPTPTPLAEANAADVLGARRGIEADGASVLGARRIPKEAAVLGARRGAETSDANDIALYLMLMGIATGVGAAYATARRKKREI